MGDQPRIVGPCRARRGSEDVEPGEAVDRVPPASDELVGGRVDVCKDVVGGVGVAAVGEDGEVGEQFARP